MQSVVAALHVRDTQLQFSACEALLYLTSACAENRARAHAAGAAEAVLSTVAAHAADAELQAVAWHALANVTAPPNVRAALAGGAVLAAVACMRAHATDEELQLCVAETLGNLLATADQATRLRALDAGVLEALLAAMQAHPRHSRVQGRASGALGFLFLLFGDACGGGSRARDGACRRRALCHSGGDGGAPQR